MLTCCILSSSLADEKPFFCCKTSSLRLYQLLCAYDKLFFFLSLLSHYVNSCNLSVGRIFRIETEQSTLTHVKTSVLILYIHKGV